MTVAGPVLFARYAFPPNALGYCGPDEPRALLEYASAGVSDGGLVDLARRFEGAWPYLQLIAAANGIDDPLDASVVDAYWVGSPLLDRVPASMLVASLDDRFRRRAQRDWDRLLAPASAGAVPHHNLHVFAVYPWVGLLREGRGGEIALRVLDRCRIRDAQVVDVDGDQALVRSRPLAWDAGVLRLDDVELERVTVAVDGYRLVDVRPGDWVAVHWDWVCDRLDERRRQRLRRYTNATLDRTNAVTTDLG